jgi:hypothetical protein
LERCVKWILAVESASMRMCWSKKNTKQSRSLDRPTDRPRTLIQPKAELL